MSTRKIIWTKRAVRDFTAAISYIRQNSEQNADNIKLKLLDSINKLSDDKIVLRKDPYKKDNNSSFLYFEILKYRIVYQVKEKEVFIIRLRHTSMEPKFY